MGTGMTYITYTLHEEKGNNPQLNTSKEIFNNIGSTDIFTIAL